MPTGFPVFDGFFADPVYMPETARVGIEPVVDLPCVVTYEPPPLCPVAQLRAGPPVFASFNRPLKIDEQVLLAWSEILQRVPESRLALKHGEFKGEYRERVLRVMGATAQRVDFLPTTPHMQHMVTYGGVDLALDPFVHSGGLTTLEAAWMGVPTVTLPGTRPFSRVSASVYTAMDHTEFIVKDRGQYVEDAVAWVTTRRKELSRVRETLRLDLQRSPVMTGYVQAVEDAYRTLWQKWCRNVR